MRGSPSPPPHPTQQEANTRCVVIHLTNTLEDLPYAATLVGTKDTVLNETCMSFPGKIYVMKKRRQTAKKNTYLVANGDKGFEDEASQEVGFSWGIRLAL